MFRSLFDFFLFVFVVCFCCLMFVFFLSILSFHPYSLNALVPAPFLDPSLGLLSTHSHSLASPSLLQCCRPARPNLISTSPRTWTSILQRVLCSFARAASLPSTPPPPLTLVPCSCLVLALAPCLCLVLTLGACSCLVLTTLVP